MDSAAMSISPLSGRELSMIDRRQASGGDYDDDGAGRLANIGVFLVLAVVAAGVALSMHA